MSISCEYAAALYRFTQCLNLFTHVVHCPILTCECDGDLGALGIVKLDRAWVRVFIIYAPVSGQKFQFLEAVAFSTNVFRLYY